jgi:transposase
LDVHKATVVACVLTVNDAGKKTKRVKVFGTYFQELHRLRLWLHACKVTHVAMESTGIYWKPIWNVLESGFELLLANPYHMKNIPGRKTDQQDAEWIAELHQHGLLRPSFVPPRAIRDLRDLTRSRVKLTEEYNRLHNRIHKVLEDANLKLDTVASDILGATGRGIIRSILKGHEDPGWLADNARSRLRSKQAELRLVLRGKINDHHRFMLKELMDEVEFVEGKIARLESRIEEMMKPYQAEIDLLCTIPGIKHITAWTLLAELGADMNQFPDAHHLASWAGLCPGNNESAGKRKSNRTRKGNRWLRRALCQSAWAVAHSERNYLTAVFYRRAGRHGLRKAVVATAHQLLIIVYHMLRDKQPYRDLGADYFDRLNPERTKRKLIRRIERLGFDIVVQTRKNRPVDPSTDLDSIT